MAEEILGGWDEAVANLARPTTDKLAALGIDTESFKLASQAAVDRVNKVSEEISFAQEDLDSLGAVSPQARNYQTDEVLAKLQSEDTPYVGTNLLSNLREDRRANYERVKKLTHDLAHEGSGEQAILDFAQLKSYENEYSEVLQPEQAHALSKELGMERKFDGPVTEGKVRFEVAKAQLHQAREKELSHFLETGDYSSFQNLMIGGSALSGAFTGLDLAGVALTSWTGWLATAKVLQGFAQVAKTTKNMSALSQALRLAQKMSLIEKKSAACQDAVITARESLLLNTGMFAADAMVSDLPRLGLKIMDSSIKNDNSFSVKDAIGELMIDGVIGGAIPVAGAGIKGMKNALFKEAKEETAKAVQEGAAIERLKGHEGNAEAIEKEGKVTQQVIDQADEPANAEPLSRTQQNFLENSVAVETMNLSDAEQTTLTLRVAHALQTGDVQDLRTVLTEMPFRYTYYSNIAGMMDNVVEAANKGLSGREFYEEILSKLPIEAKRMDRAEGLEGILDFIKTLEPSFIQVKERGALGRAGVYGLTPGSAADLDLAIRKALFMDGEQAGIDAGIVAEQQIQKLRQIKELVDEIYNTQKDMLNMQKQGEKLSYRRGEQNLFRVKRDDGTFVYTSLENAVRKLSHLFLPDDIAQEIRRTEKIRRDSFETFNLLGHDSDEYIREEAHIEEMHNMLEDWEHTIRNTLGENETKGDGYEYYNLKAWQGNTDVSYFQKMSEVFEEMIENNRSMRNTDFIFEDVYKDKMEKLADALVVRDRIPELDYSYEGSMFKALEPRTLMKENSEVSVAYETAKAQYQAAAESETKQVATEALDYIKSEIDSGVRDAKKGTVQYGDFEALIPKMEELINTSFESVQRDVIDALQGNKLVVNVSAKLPEVTPERLAGLVKANRREFSKAVTESITKQIADALPNGVMMQSLKDKLDEAGEQFVETLLGMKPEDIKVLFETPEINLSKEVPMEKIEQELTKRSQQENIFNKILAPYFAKVSESMTEYVFSLYKSQQKTLALLDRPLERPGRAAEMIMAVPSGDYIPGTGTSLTIENLADSRPDKQIFLMRLKKLGEENGHNTNTLQQIAEDPTKSEAIMKDAQTLWRRQKGLLSKEEEQAFQANSQTAMIARAWLDQLQKIAGDVFRTGGGRWDFFSLIDSSKLHGDRFVYRNGKKMIGSHVHNVLVDNKIFDKFFEAGDEKVTDKLLYFFENLDLDNHFNSNNMSGISLNELRDTLLNTRGEGTNAGYKSLVAQYGEDKVKKAITNTEDSLIKFFNKLVSNSVPADPASASFRVKYLEEGKKILRFKNPEAEMEALKWYGYDDFSKLLDASLMKAKRVYAITSVAGIEPYQCLMGVKDLMESYANHVAPEKYGIEKANLMKRGFSHTFENNYRYMVNRMCGTYSTPANSLATTMRTLVGALGAPMIMASPVKGIADYANAFHYIFSTGWKSAKDLNYRIKTLPKIMTLIPRLNLKDKRFLKEMHLLNTVNQESLYNALTNGDTLARGQDIGGTLGDNIKNFIRTVMDINRGKIVSIDAPLRVKLEEGARALGDLVMHVGRIGESSDINRANLAIMLMTSIADNGNTAFKNLSKQAQQSLTRYNISEWEWDNIFTKHCMPQVDEHIAKLNGEGGEYFGDFRVFSPLAIEEMDDATIEGFMKANPEKHSVISKHSIAEYRQELFDKASIIINSGADEMASIPNERVKGWLRGYADPNSMTGATWSMATQYQSFGAMMNWAHWTRRWMSFIDPEDELFTNFAMATGGMWSGQVQSFTGMLAEMTIYQGMLLEALAYANGKHQSIYNSGGGIQPDVLSKKLIKPFIDTSGGVGVLLDALMGAISIGRGQGGGISFPLFPVPSAMIGGVGKVINAGTKESTKGTHAQAMLAQITQNALDTTGIPRIPVLQAGYSMLVGDRLSEIAQGSSSWHRQQARRRRTGYQRNWAYDVKDFAEDIFTK